MGAEPHWIEQRFKDVFPTRLGKPDTNGTYHEPGALPADLDRYTAAAVGGVLSDLRQATEGARNVALNSAAYRLGRFVSGTGLDETEVCAWLEHVAREIGLEAGETSRTIHSGIEAGKRLPFAFTGNDYRAAHETAPQAGEAGDEGQAVMELPKPVNWHIVLSDDTPDVDWLIPDLIEKGRLHALFAPSKSHKSLITQYLCAELARASTVMYLDYENSQADLKLRFGPRGMDRSAASLENLVYFQFPAMAALDTLSGGATLEAMVLEYQPALVIIDTTSRVVRGGENDSDTFRNLYRYALVRLKAMGIAVLRIDHSGKDVGQGQRGSSAKSDDVDTVWLLVGQGETFTLRCTHQRSGNHPELVTLHKRLSPLRFERLDGGPNHYGGRLTLEQLAKELDKLDVALDVGKHALHDLAKEHGIHTTARDIYEAQKHRRVMADREKEAAALTLDVSEMSGTRGWDTPFSQDQHQLGHGPGHSQSEQSISAGHPPGQAPGTPQKDVSQGVPEGAGTDRGGLVEAPLSQPTDTVPPDTVPEPSHLDTKERSAFQALSRAQMKPRVVE